MSGDDNRGHDHVHGPSLARAGERHVRPLLISFALIGAYFVVEVIAGLVTGSLALLSDAGHMLTDVIGLGMALAAIQLASRFDGRRPGSSHTFGVYRLEILAAFVNALLLFGVAIWVLTEAVRRLFDDPEVLGRPMLVVAAIGLVVNLVAFALLREGAKESLNVEGAYLEVLADTIGSVGVIIAAILLDVFGWTWADPVVAALIGVWILPRTWLLGRKAVRVLLQAAPAHIDLDDLARRARRHRGRGRRPRSPRVDVDVGHGRRLGAPRRPHGRRPPCDPRSGTPVARGRAPRRARHVPGRTRDPRGLPRYDVVGR